MSYSYSFLHKKGWVLVVQKLSLNPANLKDFYAGLYYIQLFVKECHLIPEKEYLIGGG